MFFTLLKEIPQMFVIAAIIWGFVLILLIRNSRKRSAGFFARHRSTLLAVLAACILTLADIWVFVEYIPTHFKKHPAAEISLSAKDLLIDSSLNDTIHKPALETKKKDSIQKDKTSITDLNGKTYLTNKASIRFFSRGDSEDIEATNHSVACSFNNKTGNLRLTGLIRGFVFENEIMQDHFNDPKYMNSEAFPKTTFTGKVQNLLSVNFSKDGNYPITTVGALTIHGITKNITVSGQVLIKGTRATLKSVFTIKRIDFGITTDEIADELEITVIAAFD